MDINQDVFSAGDKDMLQELESHMQKEEHILFPMILRGQKNMAVGPISVMESEHVQHMEALQKMHWDLWDQICV